MPEDLSFAHGDYTVLLEGGRDTLKQALYDTLVRFYKESRAESAVDNCEKDTSVVE